MALDCSRWGGGGLNETGKKKTLSLLFLFSHVADSCSFEARAQWKKKKKLFVKLKLFFSYSCEKEVGERRGGLHTWKLKLGGESEGGGRAEEK